MSQEASVIGTLGRLQHVDLREAWPHEALDFTSWLASSDGLAELQEVTGLDLQVEAQEQSVGPFRADLLCKDINSGQWVLIENQLEQSDHSHLGQLLTYAAGLEAATIVWIAKKFTDEHRAALDWLNQITDERFKFYGIEIELWRIGESALAPNFNLVSSPNDWSKAVTQSKLRVSSETGKSENQLFREYWSQYKMALLLRDRSMTVPSPKAREWLEIDIDRAGTIIMPSFDKPTIDSRLTPGTMQITLRLLAKPSSSIETRKSQYSQLLNECEAIETELGYKLNWLGYRAFTPNYKVYEAIYNKPSCDVRERERWPEYIDWHVDMTLRFKNCFGSRLAGMVNSVSADELMFSTADEEDDDG